MPSYFAIFPFLLSRRVSWDLDPEIVQEPGIHPVTHSILHAIRHTTRDIELQNRAGIIIRNKVDIGHIRVQALDTRHALLRVRVPTLCETREPIHDLASKASVVARLRVKRQSCTAGKDGLDVGRVADTACAGGAVALADQGKVATAVEAEHVHGLALGHGAGEVAQWTEEIILGAESREQVADCVGIIRVKGPVLGLEGQGSPRRREYELKGVEDVGWWDGVREVLCDKQSGFIVNSAPHNVGLDVVEASLDQGRELLYD